jgi:large subunit ribosomal protein L6
MSRIGKRPITIPSSVKVETLGNKVIVTGPKGSLEYKHSKTLTVEINNDQLLVKVSRPSDTATTRHGLTRTLLANMIQGVSDGFERKLEINGVGFRAQASGRDINLALGFSHPVSYNLPEGIEASVDGNVITLKGFDKQKVGQVAADIRDLRKPEPYQGKGIKYAEEQIRRKAGKTTSK